MSRHRLNRRLTLEAPQQIPDGAGGWDEDWSPRGVVWAQVQARSGTERAGTGAPVSAMSYRIVLRAAPEGSAARPAAGHRLREGTRIYAIRAVAEADPMGRYLTCFAEEEIAT